MVDVFECSDFQKIKKLLYLKIETGGVNMTRYIRLALIGILILVPAGAMAQRADTLGALIYELNLSQEQIDQILTFLNQFAQKQANLPTTGEEALQRQEAVRQVIAGTPFNPGKAQEVSRQISEIAAKRYVNRLELSNQIFHVLNPQQQQKYAKIVEQSLEE
jgi:Spy/CpxP family protein refolding chaperone